MPRILALVIGHWLLVTCHRSKSFIGYWSLVNGHELLVIIHWSLAIGSWACAIGHGKRFIGFWSLVKGHRLFFMGN